MSAEQKAEELKRQFGGNAKYVCLEIISELEQLRKPEYTTFITSYENEETMDGYEKIEYWRIIKKLVE